MINFENLQMKINYDEGTLEGLSQLCDYICKQEKIKTDYEVSLGFVDNEYIRGVNLKYRGKDSITDVLSFPLLSYSGNNVYQVEYTNKSHDLWDFDRGRLLLGDVVISLEKALEQSKEYGHSFQRELAYLFTHSVLHLLGYDHIEEGDKNIMRKKEEEYLKKFDLVRI